MGAELGTEGSIDGNQRLVIRGKYVPKYIESLLRKYILEYVTCQMCRSPNTELTKTRLVVCISANVRTVEVVEVSLLLGVVIMLLVGPIVEQPGMLRHKLCMYYLYDNTCLWM